MKYPIINGRARLESDGTVLGTVIHDGTQEVRGAKAVSWDRATGRVTIELANVEIDGRLPDTGTIEAAGDRAEPRTRALQPVKPIDGVEAFEMKPGRLIVVRCLPCVSAELRREMAADLASQVQGTGATILLLPHGYEVESYLESAATNARSDRFEAVALTQGL